MSITLTYKFICVVTLTIFLINIIVNCTFDISLYLTILMLCMYSFMSRNIDRLVIKFLSYNIATMNKTVLLLDRGVVVYLSRISDISC